MYLVSFCAYRTSQRQLVIQILEKQQKLKMNYVSNHANCLILHEIETADYSKNINLVRKN